MEKNNQIQKYGLMAALFLLTLGAAAFVLREDFSVFFLWWMMFLVLGIAAFPLAHRMFARFPDHGVVFSKLLGIFLCGYVLWVVNTFHILPFNGWTCAGTVLLCLLLQWGVVCKKGRHKEQICRFETEMLEIWKAEYLFFCLFLIWTYFCGFHPEAYGTEKFMDYGFMAAMDKSAYLPAADLWFAGKPINYYYGGQYFAVFLTKLSRTNMEQTYNLMRAAIAAFTFCAPVSLVRAMLDGRKVRHAGKISLFAGMLAAFAGNGHYLIFGLLGTFFKNTKGTAYYFPDSTRYIGYFPKTGDKTIHEFPAYSFVLGDLHAHVVNLLFVLLILGILSAWVINTIEAKREQDRSKAVLFPVPFLLSAVLAGSFAWMNFWDAAIYAVVLAGTICYVSILEGDAGRSRLAVRIGFRIGVCMVLFLLSSLPFTIRFDSMVTGIAFAKHHTPIYQFLILWGLPFAGFLCFAAYFFSGKGKEKDPVFKVNPYDLFMLLLGLCAVGLCLIPELVYVRDIYENGYARANTMFKLTYQAFVLFCIFLGYAISVLLSKSRGAVLRRIAAGLCVLLSATLLYYPTACRQWFGTSPLPGSRAGLNALSYLETTFPEDAPIIRYLNRQIKTQEVVLEAPGESYSKFERISAMTGLPTVIGWHTHEWLWRSDLNAVEQRKKDAELIYTQPALADALIAKYQIRYIVIGTCEREAYPALDQSGLEAKGEVVLRSGNSILIRISENR